MLCNDLRAGIGERYLRLANFIERLFESGKSDARKFYDVSFMMYVLQEENWGLMPVLPMVVARIGKHYLAPSRTEGTALEKFVQSEIETKSWPVVLGTDQRKREVVLKLYTQQWLQSCLK